MSSDGISEGADYLLGLKQSGSPRTGGAATADIAPATRAIPGRVEKRKSPRYKCRGSARLQAGGNSATTWATFADISMDGCYVEATSPYRVSTVLSLELKANGFKVEATGQVQVVYRGLGMGICFTRISEENRGQLRELVHSISS